MFVSEGTRDDNGNGVDGYCLIEAPNRTAPVWSNREWTKEARGQYSNVDARHSEKAVCGFLDGSIRKRTVEELRDTRLWSHRASELDDPVYLVQR